MPVVASIFKLSQQWGIVFPINIAFWLFTHGQMAPYPAEGQQVVILPPRARWDTMGPLWCPIPPVLWWEVQALCQGCVLLTTSLAQLHLQTSWEGKEYEWNSGQKAEKQHGRIWRGRSFPCTPVAMSASLGKPLSRCHYSQNITWHLKKL